MTEVQTPQVGLSWLLIAEWAAGEEVSCEKRKREMGLLECRSTKAGLWSVFSLLGPWHLERHLAQRDAH